MLGTETVGKAGLLLQRFFGEDLE